MAVLSDAQIPLALWESEGPSGDRGKRKTVLSYGLGADSTLVLVQMLKDPVRFGLEPDLSDLIVITAMTGNEFDATVLDVERYILPRLREAHVRYVQVARCGPLEKDGWAILDDSCTPERVFPRGAWTLLDELQTNGTVVQAAGGHACSQKYKGWVLDSWARREFPDTAFRKVLGYNAEEVRRAMKSDACQEANNRAAGRTVCTIEYPLIDAGYDRAAIERLLLEEFGVPWSKSYCFFCPFSGTSASRPVHLARLRQHPRQAVEALSVEYVSMALNENGSIYPDDTLYGRVAAEGDTPLLRALEEHLASVEWQLYRVRRVFPAGRSANCRERHGSSCRSPWPGCEGPAGGRSEACQRWHGPVCDDPQPACQDPSRKGQAARSVEVLATGSRERVTRLLREVVQDHGEQVETGGRHPLGHVRGHVLTRRGTYPAVEEFVVVAPAGVAEKRKRSFDKLWNSTVVRLRLAA